MDEAKKAGDAQPLRRALDVEIELIVRLGRAELTFAQVAGLAQGQVLELDRFVDDPVDVLLNGQLVARGEIAVEQDGPVVVITEVTT